MVERPNVVSPSMIVKTSPFGDIGLSALTVRLRCFGGRRDLAQFSMLRVAPCLPAVTVKGAGHQLPPIKVGGLSLASNDSTIADRIGLCCLG